MYKIKPPDIEEVHWQTFDKVMQGRVTEAIKKISTNEEEVNEENLKQELDMGPKQWGKFRDSIIAFARAYLSGDMSDKRELIILAGLPGSGKSTFAKQLEKYDWIRINQDELGSRKRCKKHTVTAFKRYQRVVIDRCNFDTRQRASWIQLAQTHKIHRVRCIWFDVDADECLQRIVRREDHPTIKDEATAQRAISMMQEAWIDPDMQEGFVDIIKVVDGESMNKVIKQILGDKI